MEFKLGILGFGNMGSAIAEGALLKGVVKAGNVYVYNRSNPAMLRAEELGFNTVSNESTFQQVSSNITISKSTLQPSGFVTNKNKAGLVFVN